MPDLTEEEYDALDELWTPPQKYQATGKAVFL
jgi:hypothetical protein